MHASQEEMAALRLILSFYMFSVLLWNFCWSYEINQQCSSNLTAHDRHMSAYVGKVFFGVQGVHKTGDKYEYTIGVCADLGNGCGVLQQPLKNKTISTHCLGSISSAQVARSSDGMWIELTYAKGDRYSSHCGNRARTVRIIFFCDPAINGKGNAVFLEENNEDEICYYMFNVASKAVCGYPGNLSIGDIILIIAAVLLFVWLLAMAGGLVFKRFVQGAKGWEQVPLIDWYKAFGNLESDGCDLVCRTRSTKLVEYREPSFGADTDEEDDEKDDNLLPM